MALNIYVNTGSQDSELNASGTEFTEIDLTNDRLIFSAGNTSVSDGNPSPSDAQLNSAGVEITGVEQTVGKYFLDDDSSGTLKEIHNMGSGNFRYVIACEWTTSTASEGVAEMWDDSDLDSTSNVSLGAGTPASSWFRGITTTDALPGVGWTGTRLAGSSDGYFLWLNNQNGALTGADVLYFNLKIIIPSTQTDAGTAQNVLVVKYSTT